MLVNAHIVVYNNSVKHYIGLTGLNAAGKGSIADLLKEMGYEYFSLSDIVREKATSLNLDHSRENLISSGNLLRKEHGPGVLAKMITEKLVKNKTSKAVVDSIRNPFEIEELRKLPGFYLIGIDAPVEIRFERSMKRGRIGYEKNLSDFIDIEKRENSADPAKQQLFECLKLADVIITNSGSFEDLKLNLLSVL